MQNLEFPAKKIYIYNMKKIALYSLLVIAMALFSSCASNFSKFYTPWHEDNYFPENAFLKDGEKPQIIKASDLNSKFREISSNWYWCIGSSGFNSAQLSEKETYKSLRKLALAQKAKIVLWAKNYTNTDINSYAFASFNSFANASFYSNQATAFAGTSSVKKYDYFAYLFIPIPDENKSVYTPGFSVSDLTQKDRELHKQNTGVKVSIVFKNTIAYYANITHGDIITEINGKEIHTLKDYLKFYKKANPGDIWDLVIIRKGKKKKLQLTFDLFKKKKTNQ